MQNLPTFSVIIPSYNGKEFLRKTLLALRKSELQPIRYIVVDDFSSDGTFEMIEKDFPEVLVIRNEKNLGPTRSRNIGASEAEGDFLVFIDNDILVREDSITNLLTFLRENPDAGMTGGKLLTENGENIKYNMGGKIGTGPIRKYDKTMPVGWIIESFIALPKKIFEEAGGFNEDYFMFGEGPDLSRRLRKMGYKTYYVKDAKVTTLEGHTHGKLKRKYWLWISFLKYFKNNFH